MNVDSNCPGPTSTTALPENNCCPDVSTSANQYKMNAESTCSVPTSHALPDNDCQNASTSANHCEINVELNCPFPTSSESVPESDCLVSSNSANQCELIEESNCPSPTISAALSRFDNMIATSNNSSRGDLQPTVISSNSYVSPAALLSLPKAPPRKSSTRRSRIGKTRILTRTTEKIALEEKEKEKQRKKQKCSSTKPMKRAKRKQRLFESNSAKKVAAALMQTFPDNHKYDMDSDLSLDSKDE